MKRNQLIFNLIFASIVVLGFWLRFYDLGETFLRYDEGKVWWYMNLIHSTARAPAVDYLHGPFSYWLSSLAFYWNDSVFCLRFVSALFSASCLLLIYPLRRYLSNIGCILAAAFLAISPAMVFYAKFSMYYNHFIFFLLLFFVLLIKFFEKRQPIWLYGASAVGGILLAIHELFLSFPFVLLFWLIFLSYKNHYSWAKIKEYFNINISVIVFCALIFLLVFCILQSFFGLNPINLYVFFHSIYDQWLRSYETPFNKSFFYYFWFFIGLESSAFLSVGLSLIIGKRDTFLNSLIYWVLGGFLVLSFIPYKLPWIFIIILPFGYLLWGLVIARLGALIRTRWSAWQLSFWLLVVFLFLLSLFVCVKWNFWYPDGEYNKLNFSGPSFKSHKLIQDLESNFGDRNLKLLIGFSRINLQASNYAIINPKITTVDIPSDGIGGYWPLPYYLRHEQVKYTDVDFGDKLILHNPDNNIYITNIHQEITGDVKLFGEYEIRHGYPVYLYYQDKITTTTH